MVGRVGADVFGETLRTNLEANGINTKHVLRDSKASSGVAMITLDEKGQNSIVVASGANMCLTPMDVRAAFAHISKADVVVLQLESPLECVLEAARQGKERGAKVILNPAPAQSLSDELLSLVDVLVPNEIETALLSGHPVATTDQAATAAQRLFAHGVGAVVLTLGSRGALLVSPTAHAIHFPPFNVQVIDTTAAGDAFVAALSVGIASGLTLENAVRQANAAGSLAVTKMGAQSCMPTIKEVDWLMKQQ
jgi:ribokinase